MQDSAWRIGLDIVQARDTKFDAQRLPVEDEAVDRVSEGFRHIGAINVPDRR
jgi:hypothetical protein